MLKWKVYNKVYCSTTHVNELSLTTIKLFIKLNYNDTSIV